MCIQSHRVIQPFIAKTFAECQPQRVVPGQIGQIPLPEIVRALMPEMAQERAAAFTELLAVDLSVGVIRLLKIHRDHSVQVTGRHGGIRERAHDVKRQPWQGNAHPPQSVNQPPFRHFHASPEQQIAPGSQIRDRAVHAAGEAESLGGIQRQQPVANPVLHPIVAHLPFPTGPHRHHFATPGIIPDRAAAFQALGTAEKKYIAAVAGESLHLDYGIRAMPSIP